MSSDSDRTLARRARDPRPFLHEIIGAVYVVAGIVVLENLPVTYPRSALLLAYASFVVPLVTLSFLVSWIVHRGKPGWNAADEAIVLVRIGAALALTLPVHFLLKSFIYLVNSRTWDVKLFAWDQAFHLGLSPSRFLVALFQSPVFLRVLDFLYSGFYYFFMIGTTAICFGLLPIRKKFSFGAAYMLLWILGTILYLAFPSWGPVFVFTNEFRPALVHMPMTMNVQHALFLEVSSLVNDPLAPRVIRFGSVAAFPSLHIGVVALLTLESRAVSKSWFRWNAIFLLAIVLGSVITGYHYLIDSYGGIALAVLAWWSGEKLFSSRPLP